MILRFLSFFFSGETTKNRFWDILNSPMVIISTRGVNTMYEECVCEIFVSNFFLFISKTFFEFAGTSQKWVKTRLPRSLKKSKIIDFAVFEPFFSEKNILATSKTKYRRWRRNGQRSHEFKTSENNIEYYYQYI